MKTSFKKNGFTVIELMLVLAIVGVLLTIGVPSMTSLIRTNELKAAKSTLLGTLSYGRGEASARREQIIACSSSNGSSCSNSVDWSNGWIIFLDLNEDDALTTDDCNPTSGCILRVESALAEQVSLVGGGSYLGYTNFGTRVIGGLTTFRLCSGEAEATNDTDHSYSFTISDAGLNRLEAGTTSCP